MDNPFPNQQRFCQSCGMPLSDEVVSDNPDYCKYCHADGHFTQDATPTATSRRTARWTR